MIVRIFTGDDGESHFQDVTPDEFAGIANNVGLATSPLDNGLRGGGMITTLLRGISTWCSCPAAPRSKSQMEAKGSSVPGDVLVAEDLTGHGHIIRNTGEEARISLAVPLK